MAAASSLFPRIVRHRSLRCAGRIDSFLFPGSADYIFIHMDAHHFGTLVPTPEWDSR